MGGGACAGLGKCYFWEGGSKPNFLESKHNFTLSISTSLFGRAKFLSNSKIYREGASQISYVFSCLMRGRDPGGGGGGGGRG